VSLEVRPVRSRRELSEFIELPYRLHANAPRWVPPLRLERRVFLNRRFNPFFKHGEAQLFLALHEGRTAGRISAHIDRAFNDYHDHRWGLFGFPEWEDDQEIASALLDAAGEWLSDRGRDRIVGPMDFQMNDESGVLVEGFEHGAFVRQRWNPPYYQALCEGAGLAKAIDTFFWELHIHDRDKTLPAMWELAAKAREEHGVTIRRMRRSRLRRDLEIFRLIYNDTWKENWGFVPYSKEDMDFYAQELHLVFDPAWFMIAEKDGEPIAAALNIPDINQVLDRMDGRLLPLGWWHFLRRRKIIDRCRVGFLGVKPEFQHTGVAAALYAEHFDTAAWHRITGGETGWILETNTAMNRAMEMMGGRIVKRYRVYEKELD
jgi:GNAT superfamily N-acetyltransferase